MVRKLWRNSLLTGLLALTALSGAFRVSGQSKVSIWLTTASNGRIVIKGLEPQPDVSFSAYTADETPTITVDDQKTYQQMEGFGASLTDASAWLLYSSKLLDESARKDVMIKLFDPVNGIGIAALRNPMGASDFARVNYTYDDNPADQNDPSLPHFSIDHDLVDIVPLLKEAKAINPNLKITASPWSAPAWMKTYDSLIPYVQGKPNNVQPKYYQHYANYFVKFIQAYEAQSIPIDYVTIQNEPGCCDRSPAMDYPGMGWSSDADLSTFMIDFLKEALLPAFSKNNIRTKILLHDFNWGDDAKVIPVLEDPAIIKSSQIGGIAWHGYYPTPPTFDTQSTIHDKYGLDTYFTEHSGGLWNISQMRTDFEDIVGITRNWSKNYIKWNLALDEKHGPYLGGCTTCTALITVHNQDDKPGQVDYTIEYYTMGHISKFVMPGAYRIDSTEQPKLLNVAFKNPDGSKVLLVYNSTSKPFTFNVREGDQAFNYTLPKSAAVTFKWH